MSPSIRILFLGDIVGKSGRRAVLKYLDKHKQGADLVIVNVENAAHGFGVQESHIEELKQAGVHVFTGGNHTFDRKEIFDFIGNYDNVLRPANYPPKTAGKGWCVVDVGGTKVGILSVLGRVFMEPLQSPFLVADEAVAELSKETKIIFVDFHAEATAEKAAMGAYLDGRVSAVVGTHTHVQTADERILPKGTAFLTDAGCCATANSIIGMSFEGVKRRIIEQLPSRFEVAEGPANATGCIVTVNTETGKATAIERVFYSEVGES
ncbi:MAG: TIGR00282 family metallophosphoesterase [Candidatus Obscuribacterales bacterium]